MRERAFLGPAQGNPVENVVPFITLSRLAMDRIRISSGFNHGFLTGRG